MTNVYQKMDFGFNNCNIEWGEQLKNVTVQSMKELASNANAEGFTIHPDGLYGHLLVGSYPMDCQSPANESWPLYLRVDSGTATFTVTDFKLDGGGPDGGYTPIIGILTSLGYVAGAKALGSISGPQRIAYVLPEKGGALMVSTWQNQFLLYIKKGESTTYSIQARPGNQDFITLWSGNEKEMNFKLTVNADGSLKLDPAA